jgi:hypothetical protein
MLLATTVQTNKKNALFVISSDSEKSHETLHVA